MTATSTRAWWHAPAAALATLCLLAACGGGDVGSGGTGAPVSSLAIGTVNGFGSVIVDGVRYDDSKAASVAETEPGKDTLTEVKMGQRVEVDYEVAGTATAVRVEAAMVGAVSRVDSAGSIVVLGQTVLVNGNAAGGPVTQLGGGYVAATDIAAGDAVEVHGMLVQRAGAWVTQATRIERLASLPAYLKATGFVTDAPTPGQFRMGTLTVDGAAARVVPNGTRFAAGEVVAVMARSNTLTVDAGGTPRLVASQVRVRQLPSDRQQAHVSGAVAALDATAQTFLLDDLTVSFAGATLTPATATLANGKYVRVFGNLQSDGTLSATAVAVLDGNSEPEAELHGTITGFTAGSPVFMVRDVQVNAANASFESCPSTGLANGLYVEIHGDLSATTVLAAEVHCEADPAGSIVEREGMAHDVDTAARRFSLTHDLTTLAVVWTADTYFRDVSPEALAGKVLSVEGTIDAGVMTATKIKLDQ